MSVAASRARLDPWGAAAIGGSLALLLLRLRVGVVAEPARSLLLASAYGAVLTASLAVARPARLRRGQWSVLAAIVVGIAALGAAVALAGPAARVPWAPTALPLALLAAVAEEALFRGALYGRLIGRGPVVAVVACAVAFAALHVPAYGWVAFPVDLGAGLLFGWQRHASGTWSVPAFTHGVANLVAMLR